MFRLPLEGHSGAVRSLFAALPAPAAALPHRGIEIGRGFHPGSDKEIAVRLSDGERTKHAYVVGKTGTGKSTLLARMIAQDIELGRGVCVIDPHGDLVDAVLGQIPRERKDEVILLDPADTSRPFGLNLLEVDTSIPHHKDFVVQETIAIIRRLFYHESTGPIFEHNLRHLILTVLDEAMESRGTLLEVPRLLTDTKFQDAIVPNLRDSLATDFWEERRQTGSYTRSEHLPYVVSKFDTFASDRLMRSIIGQQHSTINLPEVIGNKQVLLVKLQGSQIGELNANLLGMIIITKLRMAGMARVGMAPEARHPFFVYVDEFQNFASTGFEILLAEGRKYGLALVLAHQHIAQLDAFDRLTGQTEDRLTHAIFGNVATTVAFRLGAVDSAIIKREMGPPAEHSDLQNLKNFHALVKTIIEGEVYPPFTIRTEPIELTGNDQIANYVKKRSRKTHGSPAASVRREVDGRIKRIIRSNRVTG